MSIEIRSCRLAELDHLMPLLDEEFIFGKGRKISLRFRFPKVFCDSNLHNILVGTAGDEIVAALAMVPFDWREHDQIFRGAMIGAVYTHPVRRKEGLASRLMDVVATQLREQNIDFGVLWAGQQSFYARLGWQAADCSAYGEVATRQPMLQVAPLTISELRADAEATKLEGVRHRSLKNMTLRRANDYRQLPLPAEFLDLLWCEEQGKVAYALSGSRGEVGFLYELVGDVHCFSALWREICRGRQRMVINEQAGSPAYQWLINHANVTWEQKNLAMWLPISKRMATSCWEQWHVPYFDRI